MPKTQEQTSVDAETVTTSDQKTEIEEVSETQSSSEETPSQDFVEALTEKTVEPTPEQNPTDKVTPADTGVVGSDFFGGDDDWQATILGELPNGKTVQVKKKTEGQGYYLCYREGLTPKDLDGWYTSYDKAEQSGRVYLNRAWDEERAKTASA